MATFSLDISACPSGGHIHVDVKRNGTVIDTYHYCKDDILAGEKPEKSSIYEIIPWLMRSAIKKANATTLLQMKTAIEVQTWEF
jgi:hypothetical protein